MQIASWRWYELGKFKILALPLPTNPYWTTHRIFYKDKLVGAQLSVPNLEQCEDRLWESRRPEPKLPMWGGYTATQKKRRQGQPVKELIEAMTA